MEDIPEISPRVIQYRIDKMYCERCRKIYEPEITDALPGATFSLKNTGKDIPPMLASRMESPM